MTAVERLALSFLPSSLQQAHPLVNQVPSQSSQPPAMVFHPPAWVPPLPGTSMHSRSPPPGPHSLVLIASRCSRLHHPRGIPEQRKARPPCARHIAQPLHLWPYRQDLLRVRGRRAHRLPREGTSQTTSFRPARWHGVGQGRRALLPQHGESTLAAAAVSRLSCGAGGKWKLMAVAAD